MFPPRFLAAFLVALAVAALPVSSAAAADAATLADYQHTTWTAANGAPPRIADMAQTQDGWLWLATADGLFRFDGLRFERFALPPLRGLIRDRINALYAAPDGDLYLSYAAEGISVVHPDGQVEHLPTQPGEVSSITAMLMDRDGSLLVIGSNIQRLRKGKWELLADGPEWRVGGDSMLLDGRGQLWAGNDVGVWRFDRAAGRFARFADGGGELVLGPDGRVWQLGRQRPPRVLDQSAAARPGAYPHASGRWGGLIDAGGALWTLACPQPACVAGNSLLRQAGTTPGEAALPERALRTSGSEVQLVMEDREGDIWIATENGLDRFRRNRFSRSGLAGSGVRYSLAADAAGRMWASERDRGILWRLRPDGAPLRAGEDGVIVVARGREGALLVGRPRSLERRAPAATDTFALPPGPDGKPRDHHVVGILDDGKVFWTATLETGLIGWRDGAWRPGSAFRLPPRIYQSAPAGQGELWLATGDGTLVFYQNGAGGEKTTTCDIHALGLASAIFPGAPLTVSGSAGFGALVGGRLQLLRGADGDPDALRNISGMVVTPNGDHWLNGAGGLVHVRAQDWRRSMADPRQPLRYRAYGLADGYPGRAVLDNRWPSAVSADGRHLWLSGTAGVVRFDSADLRPNPVAPRPALLEIADGAAVYPARGQVTLAPGDAQFRVRFTAPALRMPERVRFEYRLDGFDHAWVDAGTRREARYTRLAPGDYVFRVRAANEDGIGGAPEASVALRIEPTLSQTLWFRLACALAIALAAVLLYRYRVRRLTARLTEGLHIRTAERERIARTLHDTFLQSVQSLVLRVDAVAARLAPEDPARAQLENVLADAGNAIGEGRGQLQELRGGDGHVLEDVVVEIVTRLRASHGWIAVDLRVEGERRVLLAAVSEEIAEIVREALRNAFTHAGARHIGVDIEYGARTLQLRIADDGRGMDEAVRKEAARAGHFGLVGMRERAARIGARLVVDSGPQAGTAIALAVPATRAYA